MWQLSFAPLSSLTPATPFGFCVKLSKKRKKKKFPKEILIENERGVKRDWGFRGHGWTDGRERERERHGLSGWMVNGADGSHGEQRPSKENEMERQKWSETWRRTYYCPELISRIKSTVGFTERASERAFCARPERQQQRVMQA